MFNSKKLKIIACSLFLFLIIILPIGNVYAEDSDPLIDTFKTLLLISPATWPLQTAFKLSELVSFDPIGQITSPVNFVAGGIIKGAADLIFLIGSTIMDLGQGILTSVIGSPSTWLNPTNNPLVTKGWGIVRNVANAVLVIGLVIIAINIILGREENKAKKTLINFIIVALLINFTPVLCGFVIDGANILTKSFVSGGINGNMSAKIIENFSLGFKETGNDAVNAFLVSLVFLIFAFISTFIYVLYSLLFLGRSIILWLLVIFSPIAFATKVFPQSKYVRKIFPSVLYWDDWVESFFQWCVIGIPAGMSIYLANMLIPAINFTIDTSSNEALMGSIVNSAFQCLTPFIILIAGFFISISAGGQVGSYVGGVATGAWAMSGGKITRGVSEKVKAGGEWAVERTGAAASYVKEGAVGMAGVMAMDQSNQPRGLSILNKEDREIGRQAWAGWKKRTVQDTPLKYLTTPPALEKDKEAAMENYNKNWDRYSFDDRQKIEKMLIDKDPSSFLKGGINKDKTTEENSREYQRRLASIAANGGEKAKFDAYLHASGKTDLMGPGGLTTLNKWATDNKINVAEKIQGMSVRDAKDKIGADAIRQNPEILKNIGGKAGVAIVQQGSEDQRRAMRDQVLNPLKNKEFMDYMKDRKDVITHQTLATREEEEQAKIDHERATSLLRAVWRDKKNMKQTS